MPHAEPSEDRDRPDREECFRAESKIVRHLIRNPEPGASESLHPYFSEVS